MVTVLTPLAVWPQLKPAVNVHLPAAIMDRHDNYLQRRLGYATSIVGGGKDMECGRLKARTRLVDEIKSE